MNDLLDSMREWCPDCFTYRIHDYRWNETTQTEVPTCCYCGAQLIEDESRLEYV